jgi:hypothetical protein
MTDPEHKYTDAHVRANRELYEELAQTYLQHYSGEFDLLLSYQQRVELDGELTVPMIRATLNCMRFDAQVVNMPKPPTKTFDADVVDIKKPHRHLTVIKKPRYRYIKLHTTWNKTYCASLWSSACRVHRVHPDSHFEWDTTEKKFVCKLWWTCKSSWDHARFPFELLDNADAARLAALSGWAFCRKCATLTTDEEGKK